MLVHNVVLKLFILIIGLDTPEDGLDAEMYRLDWSFFD
jgi:hypothetical protein